MPVTNFQTPSETTLLYNGDIRLVFTPGEHRYQVFHKGVQLYGTKGVTTIIGIIDKPELIQWCAKVTNEAWVNALKGKIADELTITQISKEAPLAWKNTRDNAGDLGTLIHKWIESSILAKIHKTKLPDPPVNTQMQTAVLKFLQWEKDNVASYLGAEEKVYSLKHNVAGTVDFLYINKEGRRCIGDIKTSKGIYKSFFLQLAAYRYMLEEENPSRKYDEMTIVRVGKDEGEIEVKKVDNYEEYAKAFLACVVLHKILKPIKKY